LNEPTTTPDRHDRDVIFIVTHPFHPLVGQRFPLLMQRVSWGEPRVFFADPATAQVRALPTAWTDLAPPDPFRLVAGDRAILRLTDLQRLQTLLKILRAARHAGEAYPGRRVGDADRR
jgi:hypothetical protein